MSKDILVSYCPKCLKEFEQEENISLVTLAFNFCNDCNEWELEIEKSELKKLRIKKMMVGDNDTNT